MSNEPSLHASALARCLLCAGLLVAPRPAGAQGQDARPLAGKPQPTATQPATPQADSTELIAPDDIGPAMDYKSPELTFQLGYVEGVPFAAEMNTEIVRRLPGENRAVHRTKARIFRDGHGRTRVEYRSRQGGVSAPDGGEDSYPFVLINDFVGGERFEIDLARNAAQRMNQTPADAERQLRMVSAGGAMRAQPDAQVQLELRRERLEPRQIEGVEAEGTRKVLTIPAGLFDNERPYEITHEEWYSPELKMVVMMRHDDPLSGEVIYRLTNVTRGEQDRALFAPPAGVKITELHTGPPAPPSGAPKTAPSDGPKKKPTTTPVGR